MGRETQRVIEALEQFVERQIAEFVRRLVAQLTADPPTGTPIQTGFARQNWIATVGAPQPVPIGTRKTATPDSTVPATMAQDVASIYRLRMGNVYITNTVHYITLLERGTSQQSPAGFTRRAIAQTLSAVSSNFA